MGVFAVHELFVAQQLYEQVRRHCPAGTRPVRIRLQVGALEHLDEATLRMAWQAVVDGTEAAESELLLERVPLRVRCAECGLEYEPADTLNLGCPSCGAARPEILAGLGIVLHSIEAEQDEVEPVARTPDGPARE